MKTIILTNFRVLHVDFDYPSFSVVMEFGGIFFLGVVILLISLLAFALWRFLRFQLVDMDVEISGAPKVAFKLRRDYTNLYIANRIYVELITRKATLPFEEGKDVIVEMYDSWYYLFGVIRDELKNIPGQQLQVKNASVGLVGLTTEILNKGLRPHLTTYQASFRKWYEAQVQKEGSKMLSPQQIQATYPQYQELVKDLKNSNKILMDYARKLKKLIEGK